MISKPAILAVSAAVAAAIAGGYHLSRRPAQPPSAPSTQSAAAPAALRQTDALASQLKDILAAYRKTIVLLADEQGMTPGERAQATAVGQGLFHDNQERIAQADAALAALAGSGGAERHGKLAALLDYIEADPALYDADRLAFRELLQSLQGHVARDSSLPAIKLHKRISEDMDALAEIERNYDKEIRQIFGRYEQRGIALKRERWDDYVAHLKKLYSREAILKEYGVVMPYQGPQPGGEPAPAPPAADTGKAEEGEIFGTSLPKKTVVLTFDDGPHKRYSEEIGAILKQYGVPAVFFNVGRNLGSLDEARKPKLNGGAEVSRKLKAAGYTLANHSFSHAQLSKQTGGKLQAEILDTDVLLKAIDADRSPLFRFPYGARNSEGMAALDQARLKSVMWNIDSLDWADPVPSSIADRVLKTVDKEGRGIILFHDIHERTVKALPAILDRLVAEGYQFAGWDGSRFKVAGSASAPEAAPVAAGYGNSWAIVVGIDDYAKWPKLQYAVRDAQGVRQTLIDKFGFAAERVVTLKNGEATRNGILGAFHDKLAHGGVQRNDRIFVFFAGHGATRKLSSGRDLGYIVPVDADPNQLATDAIPMTEIQNIAESLNAKHVLFVMDACYSGLGLTRGGGSASFLRDNAKRIGRQMLTAGGGDQLVADGGPNGHSVFTWTLLQGLGGKGDLNGDGLITATELAAYVAPAVAGVSSQTPAFGSLPGSEGGDFVFELPAETEFLGAATAQLSNDAIAMNSRLEASGQPAAAQIAAAQAPAARPVPVTVKDLQGNEQKIIPPAAVPVSARLLAQRANDRGLQLYKEKQYAAAEAQFTEALKLRTDFALAANNLGFVFYKQDRYKEAARWFENTIRIDPSRAIAYLNLGDASARSGDTARAKSAYNTYLALAPAGGGAAYAKQQLEKL
ncbi:polysaccharide deacetylase family protein [Pseudoduganella namucuonensis]|uniref:Peptidoglycan/xylan/chitin deacetylase, PgdA/CDA1 family n=1 Tax=Pseudoduganella namucuonensis TaxID=1035707 RepID=A0A1I7M2E2_9BURK|nr:polysaccharide deacetylase family protein [Pseudoduganella namucuonensis]SFV16079.1 Peptidoglycan/xylan/chitin deacetylase, PgdA/CDA1 family [Pseudoduganella namucuonensis]